MVNKTPGVAIGSTLTQVLRPTVVNEIIVGWAHNRFGFLAGAEGSTKQDVFDYRTLYGQTLALTRRGCALRALL